MSRTDSAGRGLSANCRTALKLLSKDTNWSAETFWCGIALACRLPRACALFAHDPSHPKVKFIDLTQDFSLHTPAFAGYAGPAIRWIKRLAFDKAGGQEITMTMHVTTHLDAHGHRDLDRKSTRLNSSHT